MGVPATPHFKSADDDILLYCSQSIALFLCDVASLDVELWVSAEALDSIFDVFAEDDTDAIVADVRLVDQLRALVPTLKSKVC